MNLYLLEGGGGLKGMTARRIILVTFGYHNFYNFCCEIINSHAITMLSSYILSREKTFE